MNTNIYRLNKSLGKYRAFRINEVSNDETCGEITNFGINQYYDGKFEANIYFNGQLTDITLNEWTFSFHFKGEYHLPGSFHSTSFEIECLDPHGTEVKVYSTHYNHLFSEEEVLCEFLEMIHVYCHFENAEKAGKFNCLSRVLEEGLHGDRGRIAMNLTEGDVLNLIKYFKDVYKKSLEDGEDESFLTTIKNTVNAALDVLKSRIDLNKIN